MRSKSQTLLTQQISQIQSLLQEGKIIEAEHQARNLLQATPNNEELLLLIAKACQALGKAETSVTHLTNLLKLKQHHAEANKLLANHYFNSSAFEAALTHINAALAQSTSPETQELKGLILAGLHEYDKAIETFLKVIDSGQASWLTWNNLANQYRNLGLFKEAKESYLKAIELSGSNDIPYNNLITFLHYLPESKKNDLKSLYKNWEAKYSRNSSETKHQANISLKNKKIRIGMVSDGFRYHPVGQMITSALEALPENEIELYTYSTNNTEDQLTYRTKKASEKWISVAHLSEEKLAQEFINDKIDILFDLCGHNNGCRLRTMAMKPAPILIKWVGGLINTTGLSAMDYLLSDSIETPAGEDEFYTEKLIRMPDDYICYNAPIYTPDIYSPPAKRNSYITLGCFNNPTKLNYVLLSEWAKIMHSLPESRLFLKGFQFSSAVLRENIRNQLSELGITGDRVLIEGPSHHEELLKSYNKVDIALDTWPYSGGLTTCEAMYMGVPVVTHPGPTFAGLHSATHLTNAGMPQLVAESWEHYHDLVITLASDIDNLANIRQHLRGALLKSPVCDAKRFARNFSNAMRAIWQRHCEGKKPAALTLDKSGNAQFEDEAEPVQLHLPEESVLVEDDNFHFSLSSKITIIDNGATLPFSNTFINLHKLNVFNAICLDPGSQINNHQQLAHIGQFSYHPMIVLGNGSTTTLYATVDPCMSSTLSPMVTESEIIAKIPINTIRLDDIKLDQTIDWLILDSKHNISNAIDGALYSIQDFALIQINLDFTKQYESQTRFSSIIESLSKLGFTFYDFKNQSYSDGHSTDKTKVHGKNKYLSNCTAIFIPSEESIKNLKDEKIMKLAFIAHSFLNDHELCSYALSIIASELKAAYDKENFDSPTEKENNIKKSKNQKTDYNIDKSMCSKSNSTKLKRPVVLSMFCEKDDFENLHISLLSLLHQNLAPNKIVLWIAEEDIDMISEEITEITAHGIEIKTCKNTRIYNKLFLSFNQFPDCHIIYTEPGRYYPPNWIKNYITKWELD